MKKIILLFVVFVLPLLFIISFVVLYPCLVSDEIQVEDIILIIAVLFYAGGIIAWLRGEAKPTILILVVCAILLPSFGIVLAPS